MSDSRPEGGTALTRLSRLGYALPAQAPSDAEKYVPYRHDGATVHVAGQLPYLDGELAVRGLLGRDVAVQAARALARQAAVNALAVAASAVGNLDRVRIVQMLVFVASTSDFGEQSRVADAASELLVEVLGEGGRHARTAIGVAALPQNSPVEIQLICTTT
jgi:enamine deaminase RidA (YjgF/YER057c/UK114 family)